MAGSHAVTPRPVSFEGWTVTQEPSGAETAEATIPRVVVEAARLRLVLDKLAGRQSSESVRVAGAPAADLRQESRLTVGGSSGGEPDVRITENPDGSRHIEVTINDVAAGAFNTVPPERATQARRDR